MAARMFDAQQMVRLCSLLGVLCYQHTFSYSRVVPPFHNDAATNFYGEETVEREPISLPRFNSMRTRRSVSDQESTKVPENIYLEFQAFKKTFHINFTLDSSYVSPYLIVQKGNSTWIDMPFLSNSSSLADPKCIYTGLVNNEQSAVGSANLCNTNGMTATFLHQEHEYSIEPKASKEDGTHTILRRVSRSAKMDHEDGSHQCATDATDEKIERLYAASQKSNDSANQIPWTLPRNRRSISREHTLELMIVVDSKMAAYHGDGLEKYVLSLIAVASRIYKDGSLGNFLNLALVKIRILTDPKEGPNITSNAQASLAGFCRWQFAENEIDDTHPYHHDAAVLMTRENICRSDGKCGTLGLAELGTACDPKRSCAIIEDNGLSSAFTIAHEIGHIFGVPHDDSNACTKNVFSGDTVRRSNYKESQFHLMSSTLDYNSKTWSWSACSRRFLTNYLDRAENIKCLQDKPTTPSQYQRKMENEFMPVEPGEDYDKNRQCELVYGKGAKICPYMPVCRRLWCTLADNTGCRTQHMPWADGTRCGGPNEWCQRGVCEPKSLRPAPTDGKWSLWESWSECSRTCGGGVKYSERTCDNPSPQSGGKFCIGKRIKYKSCNTKPCPPGYPSYREKQCEAYNGRRFNYEEIPANPKYTPYFSEVPSELCKLYCSVEELHTTNFYKMSDKVEDGTKCTKDGTDICVNGICMPAGCDNVLGSNQKVDVCGICGGDNSTCRLEQFSYKAYVTGHMSYGYNTVATLPINSSSVVITQTSVLYDRPDENYLAMRDSKGTYLFNGQFIVMMYGLEVKLNNGATIEFSGSEKTIERIAIGDFISEELTIEVLSVGSLRPANVSYSYVLPVKGKISFQWSVNESWTECSSECGGTRSQLLVCLREQDSLVVNEKNCIEKRKPAVRQQKCNLHCVFRWKTENIEDCSANCGRGFVQRKVTCIKQSIAAVEVIADEKCEPPKPSSVEACQGRCAPTLWQFTDWTNCSKTCGGGVQSRQAKCTLRSGRIIGDFACNKQSKVVRQACNTHDCTQYSIGDWGQCSVSCGLGSRSRSVVCFESGRATDLSKCGNNPPPSKQSCRAGACPRWITSDWTDCSATCGVGFRYRDVRCVRGNADSEELGDEYCADDTQPTEVSNCTMVSTCPKWLPSNWSACSVTCGDGGIKRRAVECRDHEGSLVAVNFCQMDQRLPDSMPCSGQVSCSRDLFRGFNIFGLQNRQRYVWKFGPWSACSATCGEGVIKRQVTCIVSSTSLEREVTDSFCRKQPRPAEEKICRKASCGVWRSGIWSQCSTTCGEGVQSRVVICTLTNGDYGTHSDCDLLNMPESEKPCDHSESCLPTVITTTASSSKPVTDNYWRVGTWTKCSKTCNSGLRRRAVECYKGYSRGSECSLQEKPLEQELCNEQSCPTWRKGGWTKCSSACGYGKQQRMVICQLYDKSSGNADLCDGDAPIREQECMEKPCGAPVWSISPWGQCSVSCGAGDMLRNVTCVDSANVSLILDSSQCSLEARPNEREVCIQSSCNSWKFSEWGDCTGSCASSVHTRSVWCSSLSGMELIDSQCTDATRPPAVEPCKQQRCLYRWHTTDWSECSASCGGGSQMRKLHCTADNGTSVDKSHCSSWPKPSHTKTCNQQLCPVWKVSNWDECSVTCGSGQKLRLVKCINTTTNLTLSNDHCDVRSKPREITLCQVGPCPIWKSSSWSQCSGPCNSTDSSQNRQVLCVNLVSFKPVSTEQCDESKKPATSRPCQNCSYWVTDEWSRCSETCGVGIQARRLQCVGNGGAIQPDENCSNEPAPKLIQSCQSQPCVTWKDYPWSRCSTTCGKGTKTRIVKCVDINTEMSVPKKFCADIPELSSQSTCFIHQKCPMWSASSWTHCSASCGNSIKRRNVTCTLSNGRIADGFCDDEMRPHAVEKCPVPNCQSGFQWKTEKWSECSASCGYGVKSRVLKCYSIKSKNQVPLYFCSVDDKPPSQRSCQRRHCPFSWWADKWSQCSASCGDGRQFRKVLCKSVSSEGWYTGNSGYGCNIREKPAAIKSCNMGSCYATYVWQPGPWSKCSAQCGWGNQRRKMLCINTNGKLVPRSKCNTVYKPERAQKCYTGPCKSGSCGELRQRSEIREDGEYELLVHNRLIKIFCYKMYSKDPVEYLTLPLGANENYASIYGHRLAHPYACPYDENNVETPPLTCRECISSQYHRAGETRFTKIRINITSLRVDIKDFEFSTTNGLNQIPYGSAGDCYSALICPQGHFSINLKGTGLKVAANATWKVEGSYSNKQIDRENEGNVVRGKCGGYCGICTPGISGLQLVMV